MKYQKFVSILKSFKGGNLSEPMVSLDNRLELSGLFRSIGWRIVFATFPDIIKISSRLKQLSLFNKYLLAMVKNHGSKFTVSFLKLSALALQRKIAGSPALSYRELDSELPLPRLYSGLPRFIPIEDRRAIQRGNPYVIRWWLTLFSLYRIIKIPGSIKTSTITQGFTGNSVSLQDGGLKLGYFVSQFRSRFDYKQKDSEVWLLPIEKASSENMVSWTSFLTVPKLMKSKYPDVYKAFMAYMPDRCESYWRFRAYFNMYADSSLIKITEDKGTDVDVAKCMGKPSTTSSIFSAKGMDKPSTDLPLGRLALKNEPAGKVRVFALVDIWTQSVLRPLHDFLFHFLKGLPNDGTFNQSASVKRATEKAKKWGGSFGYDLSAATDRLPISLQVSILSELIGEDRAVAWKDLLINRDYWLQDDDGSLSFRDRNYRPLRYSVGQPMGALSSWAMLALTHHLIVQLSYSRVYPVPLKDEFGNRIWYDQYEVLGDDIVLFDPLVAKEYLLVMKSFGLEINLSKSVISNNGSLEFAKVTVFKGRNVSAIPWKMFISQNDRMGRVNTLNYLLLHNEIKHPIRYIRNMSLLSPSLVGDYGFNLVALLTMSVNSSKLTLTEMLRTFTSVTLAPDDYTKSNYLKAQLSNINSGYIEGLLVSIYRNQDIILTKKPLVDMSFTLDHPHHKIAIARDLRDWKSNLSQFEYRDSLLADILEFLIPDLPWDARVLHWPGGELKLKHMWEQRIFQSIYFTVDHFFKGFDQLWNKINDDIVHLSIEELRELQDQKDNFVRLSLLVERAKSKKSGEATNTLPQKPSLRAFSFLLKAYKDRPLWTYNIERMSHLRFMRISRFSFTDW